MTANGPYSNWDTMIQPSDNFSWNKGKHAFKFGAEIERFWPMPNTRVSW